jgi:hypothetical protein
VFPPEGIQRKIDADATDPEEETRVVSEISQSEVGFDEGITRNFICIRMAQNNPPGDPVHARKVPAHENGVRGSVSTSDLLNEVEV